jgi:hypothetical protein
MVVPVGTRKPPARAGHVGRLARNRGDRRIGDHRADVEGGGGDDDQGGPAEGLRQITVGGEASHVSAGQLERFLR